MRIGFTSTRKTEGPKIFLRRLRRSITNQGLARTTSFLWPFHDISLFSSVARPNYGRPYVLRVDNIFIDKMDTCGSNTDLNLPIFRSIKNAHGVVFQSDFSRLLVKRFMGSPTVPQCVIPNGVDLGEFSPSGPDLRNRLNIPRDAFVLMTSALWRPHKRLDSIVDLFGALAEERRDLYLLVLGGGISRTTVLDHPRIRYAGHIDPSQLAVWYRSADLFIYLSWLDACPNTVIEAIASGLPVVCSNQGGTQEIVTHAHAGIVSRADQRYSFDLVDYYSPPQPNLKVILEAVYEVLNNLPEYRAKIESAAVDINQTARRYVQFVENCLAPESTS
jgi:glycosyltransferase involved in cell wall biosynthesis